MARHPASHTPGAIEEIESVAERGAAWIRDHLAIVVGGLIAVLAAAAAIGGYASHRSDAADVASAELDRVRTDYMLAMGASPTDFEVPELANPSAAEEIRQEYIARFAAVADEHPGTVAAALARIEQGRLAEADGDLEASVALWQRAVAEQAGHGDLQAILHHYVAQAYEDAGRWAEAATAHEAAAAIPGYPLRYWALADAARCRLEAGETDRARELAVRLDLEAPDAELPEHLRAILRELTAPPTEG